jgi:CheY-like chemotaxis protein
LVVDDNETNRSILGQMLRDWSLQPVFAPSAHQALLHLQAARTVGNPLQLVILDGLLPGPEGFELADRLQADPDLSPAIIMMLSAADRQKYAQRCAQLKIAAYLEKPVSQTELQRAIRRTLAREAPAAEVRAPRPVEAGADVGGTQPLRLLLVEDTPANQKLITKILEKRGHLVDVASNGEVALRLLPQKEFDVVLMDVQMPVMDGFQATAAIRALPRPHLSGIPIIAMTAHAMQGDRERCLAAGMDAYVTKPIHSQSLIELVERVGRDGTRRLPAVLADQPRT